MPGRNAGLHLDRKSSCPCARHEGERVSGGTARHKVEVSGQFHAPGKQSPVPTEQEAEVGDTTGVDVLETR